jgi:hypothetical protein
MPTRTRGRGGGRGRGRRGRGRGNRRGRGFRGKREDDDDDDSDGAGGYNETGEGGGYQAAASLSIPAKVAFDLIGWRRPLSDKDKDAERYTPTCGLLLQPCAACHQNVGTV